MVLQLCIHTKTEGDFEHQNLGKIKLLKIFRSTRTLLQILLNC